MADHTITLTAAEEVIITQRLEAVNARRATELDNDGNPLPPFTVDQFIVWAIRNDLDVTFRELRASTQELLTIILPLTSAQRTAVLAQIPAGARKTFLQARIAAGS